jgi:Flp pilus assembly protein TadG
MSAMTLFRWPALWRAADDLGRDRRGAAAVEFALIAPVLLLTMAGLVDGSRLIATTMQVNSAAQAGADFALRRGWDAPGIQAAVASATPAGAVASVPTLAQACVVSGAIVTTAAATCAGGGAAGRFVTVAAQAAFKPIMKWPGITLPSTISAQAVVRIP